MTDTFSKEKRHEVMSKIRSKNTKIENQVRLWLYHHGIRYRKNSKSIMGNPDISIQKYKIAIFVNGCFWHGHENCKFFRLPKSNIEYWENKIRKNIDRDNKTRDLLIASEWNVFTIWECQLKNDYDSIMNKLLSECQKIILLSKQNDK